MRGGALELDGRYTFDFELLVLVHKELQDLGHDFLLVIIEGRYLDNLKSYVVDDIEDSVILVDFLVHLVLFVQVIERIIRPDVDQL